MKIICSDQGHSRLSAYRAHTTSYSPFVVTMRLYRTVIEILSLLVESRKFFIPLVYLALPVEGNRTGILPRTLTSSPWTVEQFSLRDPTFSHFRRTPTCDGQTDGHRAIVYTALAQRRAVKHYGK